MASNAALYGIIGALGVAVVGGGLYIAKKEGAFGPTAIEAALSAPAPAPPAPPPLPAPRPPVVAAPQPAPPPPPAMPAGPTAAQIEQVRVLVVDARRAITRGDFSSADRALDQAERIDPRASDVIAARRDLRDAQQRAGRDDRRIDSLVADARAAIARRDYAMAGQLIERAEQIDPRERVVQQARAELNTAQQANRDSPNRDNRRVDQLVAQARAAIARHDYAAADRLLDQAEGLDARDRDVQQARAELNATQRPGSGPGPARR